jgi:hypothetical protein
VSLGLFWVLGIKVSLGFFSVSGSLYGFFFFFFFFLWDNAGFPMYTFCVLRGALHIF